MIDKPKPCSGFTLIELMVVLLILGMIMTLMVTRLDYLTPATRLNAAGRSLASTITLAHNRAAVMGGIVDLQYDFEKGMYFLILPPMLDRNKRETLFPSPLPAGVRFKDIEVAGDRKYVPGVDQWVRISFTPLGITAGHVVHLIHKEGGELTVEVNPISGVVEVWENYRGISFTEAP